LACIVDRVTAKQSAIRNSRLEEETGTNVEEAFMVVEEGWRLEVENIGGSPINVPRLFSGLEFQEQRGTLTQANPSKRTIFNIGL
jgi:hypothetical protein